MGSRSLSNQRRMQGSLTTTIRWKTFQILSRVLLGRTFGGVSLACLDMENEQIFSDLRSHVSSRHHISGPEIVHYRYPSGVPAYFRPSSVYGTKDAWLLRDVFVSPKHGAIWTPEGRLIRESVTNLEIFYSFEGPRETLLKARFDDNPIPMVPFRSNLVYYHTLMDDVPQLLHAIDFKPESRVLLSPDHPRYIDDILSFFGVDPCRIVLSRRPLRVSSCVFVPKLTLTSFIRPCDLERLRTAVLSRMSQSGQNNRRIYISRRGTTQRAFRNEADVESALVSAGFEILRFEEMSFSDQLKSVHSAKTIVSPHGSALANLVAAREGTRVIEIMHPEWIRSTFPRLSSQLSLDHHCIFPSTNEIPIDQVLNLIA